MISLVHVEQLDFLLAMDGAISVRPCRVWVRIDDLELFISGVVNGPMPVAQALAHVPIRSLMPPFRCMSLTSRATTPVKGDAETVDVSNTDEEVHSQAPSKLEKANPVVAKGRDLKSPRQSM